MSCGLPTTRPLTNPRDGGYRGTFSYTGPNRATKSAGAMTDTAFTKGRSRLDGGRPSLPNYY